MMIPMVQYAITRKKDKITGKFNIRPNTSDEKAILEVWKKNSYQRKEFQIEKGEKWIDLGSNIGAFSVYAGLRGCSVAAYEADEYNRNATANNLILNGVASWSTSFGAVVHDDFTDHEIPFYINER